MKDEITLGDLLASESEVLRRIAEDLDGGGSGQLAAHNSTTSGHRSGSTHQSHSSGVASGSAKLTEKTTAE